MKKIHTLHAVRGGVGGHAAGGGWLADHLAIHRFLDTPMAMVVLAMNVLRWCWGGMVPVVAVTMGMAQGLFFASLGPLWLRYYGRPTWQDPRLTHDSGVYVILFKGYSTPGQALNPTLKV